MCRDLIRQTPVQADNREDLQTIAQPRLRRRRSSPPSRSSPPNRRPDLSAAHRPPQRHRHRRRSPPQPVRLPRQGRAEDRRDLLRLRQVPARRPAQRLLHRLHRHAHRSRRREHARRVRRLHRHLRHQPRGGRRRHGADLLRKPPGPDRTRRGREAEDRRRDRGSDRGRGRKPSRSGSSANGPRVEALVGSEKRLALVAADLVHAFRGPHAALDGKAMIVCMSRRICVALYDEIIKLRPDWHSDDDEAGRDQGRDDRRGHRSAGLATAHRHARARRDLLAKRAQGPEGPAQAGHRPRHVADRLRRAVHAHDVRRQADARATA